MHTLWTRDVLAFPAGNATNTTAIGGAQFNVTALRYFNYTLYDNGTLSNESNCVLTFAPYTPVHLFPNGTWVNASTCYQPMLSIAERGGLSIASGCVFALLVIVTLVNMSKHRKSYMKRDEIRYGPWSRTWTWLMLFLACACGAVSGISGLDVDRDYLPDAAITYQSLFYLFMIPLLTAAVWESARVWGAQRERIMMFDDPHRYRHSDKRAQIELYMPILFILFDFLFFLFTVPRMWDDITKQRSPEQQDSIARPAATDGRFKASGFMGAIAVCIIAYRVVHNHRFYGRFTKEIPWKLLLCVPLLAVILGYTTAMMFIYNISIMKFNSNPLWFFLLGYIPALLVVIILNIAGYVEINSDVALLRHKRAKERAADLELKGLQQKVLSRESTIAPQISPAGETDSIASQPPPYHADGDSTKGPRTYVFDAALPRRGSTISTHSTTSTARRQSQIVRSMLRD